MPLPENLSLEKNMFNYFPFLKFLSLNSNVFKNAHTIILNDKKSIYFLKCMPFFLEKKIILYYLKYFVLICILFLFCFHSKKSNPSRSLFPLLFPPSNKTKETFFLQNISDSSIVMLL